MTTCGYLVLNLVLSVLKCVEMCWAGYHVLSKDQLLKYMLPNLWRVSVGGESIITNDKSCWEEATLLDRVDTWNAQTQREYLSACLFELARAHRYTKASRLVEQFADGSLAWDDMYYCEPIGWPLRYAIANNFWYFNATVQGRVSARWRLSLLHHLLGDIDA